MHAGQERAHAMTESRLACGQRHRGIRPSVERSGESDDIAPSGGAARELDGALHCFGAAVAEEHLVEPGGRNADQRCRRLDHLLVERCDRRVPQAIDLLVHRLHHGRMPVPKTGHRDATAEVEDVSPIGRVQVRTLRGLDDQIGVPAVGRRYQLGILLAPHRRVCSRRRAHVWARPPAVAVVPAADGAGERPPTLPRLRNPANIKAMPTAS